MRDYTKGKIYIIRSHKTDLIYIGSTIQPLSVRMGKHRSNFDDYLKNGKSSYTSIEIFKIDPNPYIELIINFSCESKEELRKEEGKYIRKMKCVNKNIAGRTNKEYREENKDKKKEYDKKYYEENKKMIKENHKEYYKNNKKMIKENHKEYYKNNKEMIKEKDKKYYEENKQKIKEKNKIKIKCPNCNKEIRKDCLNKHLNKKKSCKIKL